MSQTPSQTDGAADPLPAIAPADTTSSLRELFTIAAPTVATMTSYTCMQFVDKLIVSRIGPDPVYIGAQGNGGIAAFLPISIAMGLITVISTYVSQNLGAGKPERGAAYAWNGLWLSLAWGALMIPYGVALPWILSELPLLFTGVARDPEMLSLATTYGRILIYGASISMATRALSQFFFGMHKPMVILVAGVAANLLNIVLSYALVFGRLGLPQMGIAGSALGTVIATALELSIPMALFLGPRFNTLYATRRAWRPSASHLKDLLRIGWPGGLMFGNEMLCWTYFMVFLVGQFGPLHSSAGWIAHQWMTLSFMPTFGISTAVTAMVGKAMGAKRPDIAAHRLFTGMGVALVYMGVCAIMFIVFRHQMIGVFIEADTPAADRDTLVRLGAGMLMAAAAFQLFDAVALTISGALRGAGDTVWPGIATIVLAWTFIVGGGHFIVWAFPSLESIGPWVAAASYIAALCLSLVWRFWSGKWKTIELVDRSAGAAPAH